MDLVRLYRVYQVHLPCLKSPFGAYPVDLVQALKVDLVHPTFPPGFPTRLSISAVSGKRKVVAGAEKGASAPGSNENRLPSLSGGQGGISEGVPGTPIMALKGF